MCSLSVSTQQQSHACLLVVDQVTKLGQEKNDRIITDETFVVVRSLTFLSETLKCLIAAVTTIFLQFVFIEHCTFSLSLSFDHMALVLELVFSLWPDKNTIYFQHILKVSLQGIDSLDMVLTPT